MMKTINRSTAAKRSRRVRMKPSVAMMLGLGIGAIAFTAGGAGEVPEVGDVAPPFSLEGSDGKTYKLADFAGTKTVVVAWFPKAFTGG
jgi:peroxiredoxin Q/BCP